MDFPERIGWLGNAKLCSNLTLIKAGGLAQQAETFSKI